MIQTLTENAGTIIVTLVLAGIVAAVLVRMRRDHRQGRSSCGCSCGCCPMAGSCHKRP